MTVLGEKDARINACEYFIREIEVWSGEWKKDDIELKIKLQNFFFFKSTYEIDGSFYFGSMELNKFFDLQISVLKPLKGAINA